MTLLTLHQSRSNQQEVVLRRLVSSPQDLQNLCDLNEEANRNAHANASLMNESSSLGVSSIKGIGCTCGTFRRQIQNFSDWGYFQVFSQSKTSGHLPGCKLFDISSRRKETKISIKLTGISNLIRAAVTVSFGMRSGAGDWHIGPSMTYFPYVDHYKDPAFRILSLLYYGTYFLKHQDFDDFVIECETKFLRMFRERRFSPRAVSSMNKTLAHALTESVCTDQSLWLRSESDRHRLARLLFWQVRDNFQCQCSTCSKCS